MKTETKIWLAVIAIAVAATFYGMFQFQPLIVHAQSFGAQGIGPIAPTAAQCPAGVSNEAFLCPVGSGSTFQMYVSYNGGAYVPLVGAAGVTSFNGRTGAVVSASGDYSYTQLSSPPSIVTFTTGSGTLTGTIH